MEIQKLDRIACDIIREKSINPDISIFDLVIKTNQGILTVKKALAFYEQVLKEIELKELSSEELNHIEKLCMQALKYSFENNIPLNIQELVIQLGYSLVDSKKVLDYYQKKYTLDWPLSPSELNSLDESSRIVIKYLADMREKKEAEYTPSVAELVGRLGINLKNAKLVTPFINKITTEKLIFDFESMDPELKEDYNSLATKLIILQKGIDQDVDVIELASKLDVGIYKIEGIIAYVDWVINKVEIGSISDLSNYDLEFLDKGAANGLRYSVKNEKPLNLSTLVSDLNFSVLDAKRILSYYEKVTNIELDVDYLSQEETEKIESIGRIIHEAVDNNEISGYNLDEIIPYLDVGVLDAWKAVIYLKKKIIPSLQVTAPVIIESKEKLGVSSGEIKISDSITVTDEFLKVKGDSIKIKDKTIDLKQISEKVSLRREYDFVGGLIRFKTVIQNNSGILLNNIDIELRMPSHIRLIKISPKTYSQGHKASIPNLQDNQSISVDFYLEPLICGKAPIEVVAVYQDAFGKSHSIIREPKMVETKCPPIINPGEENIARIRHLYESELPAKQFKSFRIEHDPSRLFTLLCEAIHSWAGVSVTRKPIVRKTPYFIGENYYFVLSKVTDPDLKGRQEQIVVRTELNEDLGLAFINIACEKNSTASGVLTHVWSICEQRIAEAFSFKLYAMFCPECSAPLHIIPKMSEGVKCKVCGVLFKPEVLRG